MGVYEGRCDVWRDDLNNSVRLWYKNNNGLADGRRLEFKCNTAYSVCYNAREGITLHSGSISMRDDLIGILFFKARIPGEKIDNLDPGHYIPLRRFRISQETKDEKNVVNDQVYFKHHSIIKLVDGSEELEFSIW